MVSFKRHISSRPKVSHELIQHRLDLFRICCRVPLECGKHPPSWRLQSLFRHNNHGKCIDYFEHVTSDCLCLPYLDPQTFDVFIRYPLVAFVSVRCFYIVIPIVYSSVFQKVAHLHTATGTSVYVYVYVCERALVCACVWAFNGH